MLPMLRNRIAGFPSMDPFARIRSEFDDLFTRFFGRGEETLAEGGWRAPVCMWEDDQHVYLEVELPGIAKEDIDLTLSQDVLHLAAERKAPQDRGACLCDERRYGRMAQDIEIPVSVLADQIDAKLEQGILYVTLTKSPEAQPKRIPVRTGQSG